MVNCRLCLEDAGAWEQLLVLTRTESVAELLMLTEQLQKLRPRSSVHYTAAPAMQLAAVCEPTPVLGPVLPAQC